MRDAILMGWIVVWLTVVAFVLSGCVCASGDGVDGTRTVCVADF